MKKLLTLIAVLFIIAPAYAQEKVEVTVKKERSLAEIIQAGQANAAAAKTAAAAAAAAMKPPSSNIITPLEVDLYEYTHIAMVDMNHYYWGRKKKSYNWFEEEVLMSSPLSIINPTSDKKKFKKNPLYLRNEKNESWIYLYVTNSSGNRIDYFTNIILRDSKNKILYKADYVNVLLPQSLEFLIGF